MDDDDHAHVPDEVEAEVEVEEAERAFLAGLIARGEAAPADKEGRLPAGATHELVEDDDGRVTAHRRRFSAF